MEQLGFFNTQPKMKVFDARRLEVAQIKNETAAPFIIEHHYSGCVPGIQVALGLFLDRSELVGVIALGTPNNRNSCLFLGEKYESYILELRRLVCLDDIGRNTESWFIGQMFKWLQENMPDIVALISYADSGENHFGIIYQATNWIYTGLSKPTNSGPFIVDNGSRKIHRRSMYDLIGTSSKEKVLEIFPDAVQIPSTAKYRYVYFLGNRRQRRKLRKLLVWPEKPYPKPNGGADV